MYTFLLAILEALKLFIYQVIPKIEKERFN